MMTKPRENSHDEPHENNHTVKRVKPVPNGKYRGVPAYNFPRDTSLRLRALMRSGGLMVTLSLSSETRQQISDTPIHSKKRKTSARGFTLVDDLLPQRVHQDGVRMSRAVNDGQLTLRQPEMIRELTVQLQRDKHDTFMKHSSSGSAFTACS